MRYCATNRRGRRKSSSRRKQSNELAVLRHEFGGRICEPRLRGERNPLAARNDRGLRQPISEDRDRPSNPPYEEEDGWPGSPKATRTALQARPSSATRSESISTSRQSA